MWGATWMNQLKTHSCKSQNPCSSWAFLQKTSLTIKIPNNPEPNKTDSAGGGFKKLNLVFSTLREMSECLECVALLTSHQSLVSLVSHQWVYYPSVWGLTGWDAYMSGMYTSAVQPAQCRTASASFISAQWALRAAVQSAPLTLSTLWLC